MRAVLWQADAAFGSSYLGGEDGVRLKWGIKQRFSLYERCMKRAAPQTKAGQ